jgi:ATP-dependent Clp protease, protease subunit
MVKDDAISELEKKIAAPLTTPASTIERDRFIYINGDIDEDKAKDVIEKLFEFQASDPLSDINMIINSCGGEVYSMFSITDTMDVITPDIRTVCLGTAQSAAAFIFICGTIGKRFMTKHSSLMIHQVSGGIGGTSKDMDVTVKHIRELQSDMIEEIANRSKLTLDQVRGFIDRDFYIKPKDAIEYGLCEGVLERLC